MARTRRGRRRSAGFRVIASAVLLGAALVTLEGVARFVGPIPPQWQTKDPPGVIMAGHPTRLWGMAPGVGRNADAKATINELGLRGPVPVVPRPAGRQRILLVGDSTFFGHGVDDADTIGENLHRALLAAGVDADVVNGAIPGYSTEQTRLLLAEQGWGFEPTLLMIGNLWSDNNADGFRDADLLATRKFYAENPLSRSALYTLIASAIGRVRGGEGHIVTWTHQSTWPEDNARRVPLQDYARNLDTMAREAGERGIGVAFIAPVNKSIASSQPTVDAGWDPYFAAQRAVAEWHHVPLIASRDALTRDPAPTDDKFVDLMHPSAKGAADIGQEAADRLIAAGWPAQALLPTGSPFDAGGLVDVPPVNTPVQAARYSPQAHLFPATFDQKSPGDAPDPNVVPLSEATWGASGTVAGGTPPIQVRIVDSKGTTLSEVTLTGAAPFVLDVPRDIGVAEVIAVDSVGKRTSAEVARTGPPVVLTIP